MQPQNLVGKMQIKIYFSVFILLIIGSHMKASPFFNNGNDIDFDEIVEEDIGQGRVPRAVTGNENMEDGSEDGSDDYYKEWILENLG